MRWFVVCALTLSWSGAAMSDSHRAEDWPEGSAMHTGLLARERHADADNQLNSVYRQALEKVGLLSNGPELRKRLTEAQRAWILFRDKHCAVEGDYMGGAPTWQSTYTVMCLARTTEQRVKELEAIVQR
jgi:uncharacterized protein YecT (DUF1311 family)